MMNKRDIVHTFQEKIVLGKPKNMSRAANFEFKMNSFLILRCQGYIYIINLGYTSNGFNSIS